MPFKEGKQVQWASSKGTNIHILLNAATFKTQAEEKKAKILKQIILKIISYYYKQSPEQI